MGAEKEERDERRWNPYMLGIACILPEAFSSKTVAFIYWLHCIVSGRLIRTYVCKRKEKTKLANLRRQIWFHFPHWSIWRDCCVR